MEAGLIKRIIKISRFPNFWIYTAGFLAWGGALAVGRNAFQSQSLFFLIAWFIFPGNLFLNAINDAFDYETDLKNPRKQSLEAMVSRGGTREMIWISFIALISVIVILPFVSMLVRELILLWILIILAYNLPPIRLKQYPVVDILFGGVGHFVLIGVIGYAAVSGDLPPSSLILLGISFCAAQHIFGASFDFKYDLAAGIKNTTARLGSIKNGLVLSGIIYLLSAAYGLFYELPLFSVLVLMFPALIVFNISKGDLEVRSVMIFKQFIGLTVIFGFIIGTILNWNG